MKSEQPPPIAHWLLKHFGCSPNNEAIIGDLDERYRQGYSRVWYWGQALSAIVSGIVTFVRDSRWLAIRALAIGWASSFYPQLPYS